MPVAALPGAWRYHSLFADFLRARLRAEQPDSLGRLHGAASQWYEGCGRPVPATDHALEAADWPRVLDLLAQHAERLLEQGRMRLLARWFAGIPASLLRGHPHVQMMGIWATLFTRGPWEALRQVEASACVRSDDARVQQNLAAMRPLALAMQDRYPEAYVAGVASLEAAPVEATFAHGVLHNAMANIFSVLGNAREAQRLLDGARAARGEDTFNRMYTESMEGMLDLLAGRLRHAKARFRMAVDATHAANFNQTHGNAWAGVLYACVAYESNQLERAGHLLNVYLPMAREVGLPDHMILSHVMRARIAVVEGDGDAALSTLAELEDIGYARKLPRVAVAARLERARLLMLQGDGPAALRELERADIAEIWAREREQRLLAHDLDTLVLAQLRHALEFGDPASCIAPLTRELETARLGGRGRRVLRIQLLRAMALQAAGRTPRALQDMAPGAADRRAGGLHAHAARRGAGGAGAAAPACASPAGPACAAVAGRPCGPAAALCGPGTGGSAAAGRGPQRGAHRQGAPGAGAAGPGLLEQCAGRPAADLRQHGAHPPAQHLPEAGRQQPHTRGGGGPRAPHDRLK
jgi:LuxR family maltose regulon positive regulatory protein